MIQGNEPSAAHLAGVHGEDGVGQVAQGLARGALVLPGGGGEGGQPRRVAQRRGGLALAQLAGQHQVRHALALYLCPGEATTTRGEAVKMMRGGAPQEELGELGEPR